MDGRGNRRTFTLASSPTEPEVHIGVKFYDPSSSFKQTLHNLQPGQSVSAGMLAGDFLLPSDNSQKLVWIAGGIGITPFRSHAKYLLDTNQQRDVVLFYMVASNDEVAYRDIWDAAHNAGIKVYYSTGRLTPENLAEAVPDYAQRHFYISGPNAMVQNYKGLLKRAGVKRRRITTDYFSGY
jgi:ferredoxin-NADP reductase